MKLKTRLLCLAMSVMLLASMLVIPSSAATVLPQAVKGSTAKTPTAAQQAQLATEFPGIVCYGDSLTQGVKYTAQGQNYKSYVRHLGELVASNLITGYDAINKTVNFGINGDKTANITARSGAVTAEISVAMNLGAAAGSSAPISLRLSTTKAAIAWVSLTNACETAYGGVSGKTQPNMTIDGVEGRIGYVGGKLCFIRNSAGAAKTWGVGTSVTYEFANSYANYVPVIFMGYNDGPEWIYNNYNNYKTYLESIIKKYNTGRTEMRYVIVVPHFTDRCYLADARYWGTPYSPQTINTIKTIENNLVRDFGADHVVKAREFMNLYGMSETGLSPTAEDTKRIAAGAVPSSLLNAYEAVLNASGGKTCYTHFNDVGNQLLARAIYQKMYDQGAFNKVIDIMGLNIPKSDGSSGGGGLTHAHSMSYTAAKAATCKSTGNIAYYYCSGCSGYFTDAAGNNQITQAATVVAKLTTHTPGTAASCTSPQTCTVCGVVIAAQKSHSYSGVYGSDANGHWFTCTTCGQKGTVNVHINTTENGVTACVLCGYSQHTHSMTYKAASAATCQKEGNTAYYTCTLCGKYFSDAAGSSEITLASTVIAKTNHTLGTVFSSNASGHWYACTVCGTAGTVNVHIPNVEAATTSTAKYCVLCSYVLEEKLPSTPVTPPSETVTGDANGDGVRAMSDVKYMVNYMLFGSSMYPQHQDMDYNGDGATNNSDAARLLSSILFGG